MTGGQEHAGTGVTLTGDANPPVRIPDIVKSLGVEDIRQVDPYDYKATLEAVRKAIDFKGVSVVIATGSCRMFPVKIKEEPFRILSEQCTGCGMCLSIYCPAIILSEEKTEKGKAKAKIDAFICVGCSFCSQICPADAIVLGKEKSDGK